MPAGLEGVSDVSNASSSPLGTHQLGYVRAWSEDSSAMRDGPATAEEMRPSVAVRKSAENRMLIKRVCGRTKRGMSGASREGIVQHNGKKPAEAFGIAARLVASDAILLFWTTWAWPEAQPRHTRQTLLQSRCHVQLPGRRPRSHFAQLINYLD